MLSPSLHHWVLHHVVYDHVSSEIVCLNMLTVFQSVFGGRSLIGSTNPLSNYSHPLTQHFYVFSC